MENRRVANKNAELLGLMVNDPNIEPDELTQIIAPTLVICGTKDMIREDHTRKIAENIPNARLAIIRGIILSQISAQRYLTGKWIGFWKAFKQITGRKEV